MTLDLKPPESLATRQWDVVIVGTGMGGATAGYELARRGHSVLFLERGRLQGAQSPAAAASSDEEQALRQGWWPSAIAHHHGERVDAFQHPVGCGTGGSSAVFSMVLERFRPDDFRPRQFLPPGSTSTMPAEWAIGYDDLEPHYAQAEALYRVRGTLDPLFPAGVCLDPPAETPGERLLLDCLRESGLHPYRLHSACEHVDGCDGCYIRLCSRACRNDSHRICLVPALGAFDAALVDNCRVDHLEHGGGRVDAVVADCGGRELRIRARIVVLAANSFVSPLILLRSRSRSFPDGLANGSGMVGRNLMLHVSDFVRIEPSALALRDPAAIGPLNHGIGLNDFYQVDGVKCGNVHLHPPPDAIGAGGAPAPLRFGTILEDFPYADNRILPDQCAGDRIAYAYEIRDELRERAATLVRSFCAAVSERMRVTPVAQPGNLNRSHACGTLRSGRDPRTSVLDPSNRAHEVDNLYAVDASWFSGSGGLNPSLTIAANALRVADGISRAL